MMETVLNVGLNDESVARARGAGGRRAVRLGLLPPAAPDVRRAPSSASTAELFEEALDELKKDAGAEQRRRPRPRSDLQRAGRDVQGRSSRASAASRLPAGPARAARPGDRAPSSTPGTPSAPCSTAARSASPDDLGTAVNVCSMVFGNLGDDSGHRRRVHPRPGLRRPGRLRRLPAERAGRGRRRRHPQHRSARGPREDRQEVVRRAAGRSWRRSRSTTSTCATSSSPSSAASSGCSRPGSASGPPGRRSASPCQLADQGLIDLDEALRRVTGAQLAQLMFPQFDEKAEHGPARQGHERLARRRRRQGRLRLAHGRRVGRGGRAGDPGPPRDHARRPARHGRRDRRAHLARRQDVARRRRRPRHGPHLRLRRRLARRRRRGSGRFTTRDGDTSSTRAT